VAKFPNSTARLTIAELVADEILKIKNGAVALALLERARAVFTSEQEQETLKPVAMEVYAIGNRPDDAFTLAAELLKKNPDDLHVLARMTQAGVDETRKKNRKYAEQSLQYGLKAITLLESGNKPADLDNETWFLHKANLGILYQQTAILYLASQNTQEAKARLTKATLLSPRDPSNFALLGRVINVEYTAQMNAYEALAEGNAKQEALRKLEAVLDSIIDAYARAAGLATGRPEYQTLLQQVIPDLTVFYKHRHKQSIKGLDQLINRYRPKE
jgi:tetratricopeptide (TPR) repeat protein